MKSDLFCFGILSFNHPGITEKCIRSVQSFSDDPVYLVHNGSEIKNQVLLQEKFPIGVDHISIQENRGFSGGANLLLNSVFEKYQWCLFLTNDCEILPSEYVFRRDLMGLAPGIFAPKILVRSTGRVDSIGGWLHLPSTSLSHEVNEHAFVDRRLQSRWRIPYIPGTAFLIHRQVFQQVGPFDEDFHTYWEDVEFSVRAQSKGFQLHVLPKLLVRHGIGKTCHGISNYSLRFFQGNRLLLLKKIKLGVILHTASLVCLSFSWVKQSLRLLHARRTEDLILLWKTIFQNLFRSY